ncbi:MAG: transcriptional regulator, partial [Ktedonobacteraceae bacterium]|nr:transcriptional regulator [Ktedonobacteraceae bacterium]
MPKPAQHTLFWSEAYQRYELRIHGQPEQSFTQEGEPAWFSWLAESTAFAFAGRTGRITVVKEARSRGGGYWYAYSTQKRRTSKRYLGRTDNVTFSRLEQVAKELTHQFAPAASEHPAHQTTEPLSFAPNHNGAGSGGQARSQSGGVGPDTEH